MNQAGTGLPDDTFSVEISSNPKIIAGICTIPAKDLEKVFAFVKKNEVGLLNFWNAEIDFESLLSCFKRV
jgi:hypothetical protein